MARISTYLNDNSISGEDLLAGSNFVSFNAYETKNFKIKDLTEYIQGQISVSPSNSALKANGGIVTETINGTNNLAVDLSATSITGQLANSDLANSSITINGTAVALGGTITIGEVTGVTAGTYLNGGGTDGTVTVNHDSTTRSNATSTASPAYGASFTAIDTLTTNATGHVTAVNTKTVTLPASDATTYTVEAIASTNDSIIRLIDSNSNNDDIKLIAGDNISLSTSEANDTITINSQAFGTVFTVTTEAAMISATTTGGDLVIRTDISKTFIHNGGLAGDATDFSELQFSGINSIDLTEGDGITLSRTGTGALTNTNNDLTVTNALATTTERGGVKIGYTTDNSARNYAVALDTEKAYANVPWVNTTYDVMGAGDPADYSAGLVLEGSATHGDSFLRKDGTWEVPVDTDTQYSAFTTSAAGLAPQLPDPHGGKFLKADGTWEVPAYIANTDVQLTVEQVQDIIGNSSFISGTGATTVTYDDTANTLVINSTDNNDNDNTQNTTTLSFVEENDGASPPVATGDIILRNTITGASSSTDDIKFNAGDNITLTYTDDDNITITATDTNTTNWNFQIDSGTAENIESGNTVTFTSGNGITLAQTNKTIDIAADFDGDYTNLTNKPTLFDGDYANLTNTPTLFDGDYDSLTSLPTLLGLGTTSTTALAGNTTIPSGNQIIDWTTDQGGTNIHTGNYNNTQLSTAQVRGKFSEGTNITITDGEISATDTNTQNTAAEIRTKVGTGNNGVVPAEGAAGEFLKHDGTFGTPSYTTNTNTQLSTETVQDIVGAMVSGNTETNIAVTYNDTTGKLNFVSTDTNTNTNILSGGSINGDVSLTGHLTVGGSGHYIYAASNAANVNPTNAHGLAFSWNRSGGSRESNIIFAPGSDASSAQEAECQIRFSYKAVSGTISTAAKLWSGGNFNTAGYITVQNGANTITNTKVGQWSTAYGWGNHASAGYLTSFDITAQTDSKYLRSNADDTSSGNLTVVSYKFNGNASDPTDTTATIYDQASHGPTISGLGVCFRTGSTPTQTGKLNSSGTFTVSGDIIAYGSPSDISLKENVKPISNALNKVEKLQGVTFNWKEKQENILNIKEDIGFIAQDVQKILPELVRKNENGKLSLRHQGIIPVLLEAIKELSDKIKVLENGSTK
jgi:hypothetical protein